MLVTFLVLVFMWLVLKVKRSKTIVGVVHRQVILELRKHTQVSKNKVENSMQKQPFICFENFLKTHKKIKFQPYSLQLYYKRGSGTGFFR